MPRPYPRNMERTLDVRTGESIAITYELAGLGSRFLAVMIDLLVQLVLTALVVGALAFLGSRAGASATPSASDPAYKILYAIAIAIIAFMIFVIYFGYFIAFELWWAGRTPGKRVLGIRVVRDAGFPIDVGAAIVRNVVRVFEFGLAFYALSALVALGSRENKRLGDFAAGTIVIREHKYDLANLDAYLATPRANASDEGLAPADRELIERYLARRDGLTRDARTTLAAQIAARVRPKLTASFDHLDDDALLEHLGRAG
jgi:uncharacterized RDD family membrane protein YckC